MIYCVVALSGLSCRSRNYLAFLALSGHLVRRHELPKICRLPGGCPVLAVRLTRQGPRLNGSPRSPVLQAGRAGLLVLWWWCHGGSKFTELAGFRAPYRTKLSRGPADPPAVRHQQQAVGHPKNSRLLRFRAPVAGGCSVVPFGVCTPAGPGLYLLPLVSLWRGAVGVQQVVENVTCRT